MQARVYLETICMHISYVFQCEEVRYIVKFFSQAKDHILIIYHPEKSIHTPVTLNQVGTKGG